MITKAMIQWVQARVEGRPEVLELDARYVADTKGCGDFQALFPEECNKVARFRCERAQDRFGSVCHHPQGPPFGELPCRCTEGNTDKGRAAVEMTMRHMCK